MFSPLSVTASLHGPNILPGKLAALFATLAYYYKEHSCLTSAFFRLQKENAYT